MDLVNLVNGGPRDHLLGVQDEVCPGRPEEAGTERVRCTGDDMDVRESLPEGPDCSGVHLVVAGEDKSHLDRRQAREETGIRDVTLDGIEPLVTQLPDPRLVDVADDAFSPLAASSWAT